MATEIIPSTDNGIDEAQSLTSAPGTNELETKTFTGPRAGVLALYESLKQETVIGDVAGLQFKSRNGRGELVVNYERRWIGLGPQEESIQELYQFDVVRDVAAAPYFATMTNAQIATVRMAIDNSVDIDAGWTDLQKRLYGHYARGQDAYFDTAYEFRDTIFTTSQRAINVAASDPNTVQDLPSLSGVLSRLIDALPSGEWLKKPVQVTGGRSGWAVTRSFVWSLKWSIVYGGTFTGV